MVSTKALIPCLFILVSSKDPPSNGEVVSFAKGKSEMIANGVQGFKSKGKFYKIMGSRGSQRMAFEKFEQDRDLAEDHDGHKSSKEEKLLEEEEEFLSYQEQQEIAEEKGADPELVELPVKAKEFKKLYSVDKTAKKRKKKRRRKKLRLRRDHNSRNETNTGIGERSGRKKRFAVNDKNLYWKDAVVPYIFTSDIKGQDIMGKVRAMNRFEYWTCVRFVPWTKQTGGDYGLDHNNYLKHVDQDGCWSILGNSKGDGQKISCCLDDACVHELGHSLGLQHEQKSPLHDNYIRINTENIDDDRISEYQEDERSASRTFGYYDLGSQMHYKRFMFSKNSEPTMTLFDPQMEFMLLSSDPHNFYMFKEISEIYKCADMKCKDFTLDCGEDGYMAYIEGTCQCRCPEGYDSKSGCTKKYQGDPSLQELQWPQDAFSMLKPMEGCPKGFQEGSIKQSVRGTKISDIYHVDSENGMMYFTHKFCTKPQTQKSNLNAEWGKGQYCILNYGGTCPRGFEDGIVGFDDTMSPEVLSEPIPDSQVGKDLALHFCCRNDGSWKDPISLPNSEAFVLFQKGDECQEVKDMIASNEWFMVESDFYGKQKIKGVSPEIEVVQKRSFYVGLCYYWPINFDCGEVIELTERRKEITVTSPNYPSEYNIKQQCHWSIKAPEGSLIKLNFESFDIELREDDSCGDALEIRTSMPGQPGINYCGDEFKPTVMSEGNYLGLILTSGPEVTRRGFKARISLIQPSDMCYTDKGYNYMGTTNVTRTFRPCLPWSDVQHCPHNTFNQQDLDDGLQKNYCRNPGSGMRPWCYVHRDTCLREYCDACQLEHCFDKFYDCRQLQQESNTFCTDDPAARFGCRESCGYCAQESSKPVSEVKCKAPDDIPDAAPTASLKQKYEVGENVTFRCKTGAEEEVRTCLSDGTWSGGGFVCGRCPTGWIPFKQKCYKYFAVTEDKSGANKICENAGASVAPAKDADELNFLLTIRKGVSVFWLGMDRPSKRHKHMWQEDDSMVTWTNWRKGQRSNCAFVDKNGKWVGVSCDATKYISVICKLSLSDRKVCVDAREDCSDILGEEQSACLDYPDFAWHVCPLSCGICTNKGQDIQCSKPDDVKNARELTGAKVVIVGRLFEYQCDKGYALKSGNLRRVCLKSGVLSGAAPECVPEYSIPTANNAIELRQRRRDGKASAAYVGLNEAQRIHKDGHIVSWSFYSIYDGEVALQVWRKLSASGKKASLKLIGQSIIPSTKDHRVRTVVLGPDSGQIRVQSGDYIGYFLPETNKGGLTFDKCEDNIDGMYYGHQYTSPGVTVSDWTIGQAYDFKKDKIGCKIVSLTANVL